MDAKHQARRGSNFQYEENLRLIQLVSKYRNFLQNKKSDAVTWRQKDDTWVTLCTEFNCTTAGTSRTVQQLKAKYENLKKRTRQKVAHERRNSLTVTGGGPPMQLQEDPLTQQILALISISAQGTGNEWDSNNNTNAMASPEYTLVQQHDDVDGGGGGGGDDDDDKRARQQQPASEDWRGSGYCAAMLKQFKHPQLLLTKQATEQHLTAAASSLSSSSSPSKSSSKSEPTPPLDLAHTAPQKWRRRRRPQLGSTPTESVASNNSLKYANLANAKTKLVRLQMHIIRREYEERKAREELQHSLRTQLYLLDIKAKQDRITEPVEPPFRRGSQT